MREILFRGKAQYTGEWVEGGYVKDVINTYIYNRHKKRRMQAVDLETVGQYTGLTDKNGKKIFEGDILAIGENGERYQTVSVSFKDGAFRVSHYAINLLGSRNIESEVIGNIHDNPELLKGGAENA